jgi:S-adenosylmethionine:tRNA ribosyltransferase-isomerase
MLKISDYDYTLPPEKIAERPSQKRDKSKLLVLNEDRISDTVFDNITEYLQEDDLMVFNNTRVVPARLNLMKQTGGASEVLLVSPRSHDESYSKVFEALGNCVWTCIISGKNVKEGAILKPYENLFGFEAHVLEKDGMFGRVEFQYEGAAFSEVLKGLGRIPLPPYIKRETDGRDDIDYQTVIAKHGGSVAAPTASLHYSEDVLRRISDKGIKRTEVTLHIGPGTFMPVKTDDPYDHDMHSERVMISLESISDIYDALKNDRRIIVSGTTSLRSVETLGSIAAYRSCGFEISENQSGIMQVVQFPYNQLINFNKEEIKEKVIDGLRILIEEGKPATADTKLMIIPGFPFYISSGIITNFHLPQSTLLLLVSAFIGEKGLWKVYEHALNNDYRFLSYGDASLLFRQD